MSKRNQNSAGANAGANAGEGAETTKKQTFFIWLKNTAYINDKQRVGAGVYKVASIPERLKRFDATTVEIFEKEIPSRIVAKIARWAGINPDGVEDEEILSKVVSDFKTID